MNKKYLKYLFKTFSPILIVYAVIAAFTFFLIPVSSLVPSFVVNHEFNLVDMFSGVGLTMMVTVLIPYLLHTRYFSKNSSDIYLSLPISRMEAFLTENIFGLVGVLAITALAFLAGSTACVSIVLYSEKTLLSPVGDVYAILPLLLLTNAIIYLMSVVAVNLSNSQNEAGLMIGFVHIIPMLLYLVFLILVNKLPNGLPTWTIMFTYAPGVYVTAFATYLTTVYDTFTGIYYYSYSFKYYGYEILVLLINLLVWIGLSYYAMTRFQNVKSERLGTAQMEAWGGKNIFVATAFLTNIFLGLLLGLMLEEWFTLSGFFDLPFSIFIFIIAFGSAIIVYWVITFILRRKVRFLKSDLIRFAISFIPSLIIGFILYLTCIR